MWGYAGQHVDDAVTSTNVAELGHTVHSGTRRGRSSSLAKGYRQGRGPIEQRTTAPFDGRRRRHRRSQGRRSLRITQYRQSVDLPQLGRRAGYPPGDSGLNPESGLLFRRVDGPGVRFRVGSISRVARERPEIPERSVTALRTSPRGPIDPVSFGHPGLKAACLRSILAIRFGSAQDRP